MPKKRSLGVVKGIGEVWVVEAEEIGECVGCKKKVKTMLIDVEGNKVPFCDTRSCRPVKPAYFANKGSAKLSPSRRTELQWASVS